jgi:hypothetical protein
MKKDVRNFILNPTQELKVVPAWIDFEADLPPRNQFVITGKASLLTPIQVFRGQYFTIYEPYKPSELNSIFIFSLSTNGEQVMVQMMPVLGIHFAPKYLPFGYSELVSSPAPLVIRTLNIDETFSLSLFNQSDHTLHFRARIHGITTKENAPSAPTPSRSPSGT